MSHRDEKLWLRGVEQYQLDCTSSLLERRLRMVPRNLVDPDTVLIFTASYKERQGQTRRRYISRLKYGHVQTVAM
jgi:hypothetical protein